MHYLDFSEKLPQSRLQRDLTDSTVIRNVGMAFGYTLVALKSIEAGLKKIVPNISVINEELEKNCCVIVKDIKQYYGNMDFQMHMN